MDSKDFKFIFNNLPGNSLFCPSCGKPYSGHEVASIHPNTNGLVVSIKCSSCNLSVMVNVTNVDPKNFRLEGEHTPVESEITIDEIIDFHDILRDFDGDFRRAFGKED